MRVTRWATTSTDLQGHENKTGNRVHIKLFHQGVNQERERYVGEFEHENNLTNNDNSIGAPLQLHSILKQYKTDKKLINL